MQFITTLIEADCIKNVCVGLFTTLYNNKDVVNGYKTYDWRIGKN